MRKSIFFITTLAIATAAARAQQSVPGTIVEKKGGVIVPSSNRQSAPPQQAAPVPSSPPSAGPAVNLDVVGIKLGMAAKDALLALKADNPRLNLTPASFKFEGFANPLVLSVEGNDRAATNVEAVHKASERVAILFTTPPSQEVVWSVSRSYTFPTEERPSLQVTLDALRKKYGPETVPPGPANSSQQLVWVYGAQGNPMGPRAAQLNTMCASTLGTYLGGDGSTAVNVDIHSPRAWPPQCTSIVVVNAYVSGIQIAANEFAVSDLNVNMIDGGRYRKALDATRAVILNLDRARQQKEADEVNKRGAPKL
jgi:hypothetical protein